MSNLLRSNISTFRFDGTRFTVFLRDSVIEIHNYALRALLEFFVEITPNFTGETQATFRKFRDYLAEQELDVALRDYTREEVLQHQFKFNKTWNIPAKINNLPNAGSETVYGHVPVFSCVIDRQKFAIRFTFTPSDVFNITGVVGTDGEPLTTALERGKIIYKDFFADGLRILFARNTFNGKLKTYFHRVDLRST